VLKRAKGVQSPELGFGAVFPCSNAWQVALVGKKKSTADAQRKDESYSRDVWLTMRTHVLAVAVLEIQIKLVLAEKLEEENSVWTVISKRWVVVLRKLGRKVLVVHALAQNVDLKASIKKLLNLRKIHEPYVHTITQQQRRSWNNGNSCIHPHPQSRTYHFLPPIAGGAMTCNPCNLKHKQ
jgi:hypothetical protein